MAVIAPPVPIDALVRDAAWLAHRYDPGADAVHFVRATRAERAAATFLTDDYLPAGRAPRVARRAEARVAAAPAPLHFVFHSAFCLSTLVARAFDRPGWASALKEPTVLNDIVGWRRRGGQGADMAEVLGDALSLLARPFEAGEAVVVKPSNVATGLYAAMLALRPEARALVLHAPLRTYLTSVAKKGIDGRLWVRTLLTGLLDDRAIDLGMTPRDHLGQTDLQVAGVGWLAQQALFAGLVQRFGARVRSVTSDAITADPAGAMRALAAHFALPLGDAALGEILAGPAFTTHSKSDAPFAAADRTTEHAQAAALHGDEIEKVAVWTETVAATFGVPLTLPNALLKLRA